LPILRLAVLDVDGTLKRAESPYQYLHHKLGVAHLAAPNRQLALTGQIGYAEWLRRDVALWAGQQVSHVQTLLAGNPYLPGAPELLRALKRHGVVVALVSAGFTLNTEPIMAEFGLDCALANELCVRHGKLDGTAICTVPEGGKADFALGIMGRLGIQRDQVLAAGDSRGDLELFSCADVRFAVNPSCPELRSAASAVFEPDLADAVGWLQQRGYLPAATGMGE